MRQRTRVILLILLASALVFCAVWTVESVMLSALPGIDPDRVVLRFTIAASATILFGLLTIVIGVLYVRGKRVANSTIETIHATERDAISRIEDGRPNGGT